ncbi:hypothetical protein ACFVYE_07345 [Streptomyces sp. NPDC058239]|uniref:hypothetical protein n=1 Tax=Streptomyces sp. NPDC058239 TaxID=3346395 RepID=UPI0036E5317B
MQSDTAIENDPAPSVRRRKHAGVPRSRAGAGAGAQEGPVFVDSSGRRARLLRRAGIALGVACVGYAAVLGLAFVGGISMSPSQLLPFDGAPAAQGGPAGNMPPGTEEAPPGDRPGVGADGQLSPAASPSVSATTGAAR